MISPLFSSSTLVADQAWCFGLRLVHTPAFEAIGLTIVFFLKRENSANKCTILSALPSEYIKVRLIYYLIVHNVQPQSLALSVTINCTLLLCKYPSIDAVYEAILL